MNENWILSDWLVLPYTPDQEAWRDSLYQAAAKAGRTIFEWDQGGETDWNTRPLLLTANVTSALSIQSDPARIAAVIGSLDVATQNSLSTSERHDVVRAVTDGFAQLALLPPERIFSSESFNSSPLEILPGLIVSSPPKGSPSTTPLATALEIHLKDKAIWPVEIFSWSSPFQRDGDFAVLDLTGRPRFLAFGPYIVMPVGRWKARFRITFDDYASRYLFRVDWGGVEHYSSYEFRPGKAGMYELEMSFDWLERASCEFRVLLREGAFHGEVAISDLTIIRES
ncbi:hypothetical protein [Brevundimonas sp.]|uniref:hypothetical protein n=1 Tax=Brevundimonas sp. TaxID=1871086 RepID=UPI0028A95A5D|nr:hypothetical protein [Brevundimonas sp.]